MKTWEELKNDLDNVTFDELYEVYEDVAFTLNNYEFNSSERKEAEKILHEMMDEFDNETFEELKKEYNNY